MSDLNDLKIEVDVENLYKEEIITDMKVATLHRLTPIKIDGTDDESRKVLFTGQTQLMSPAGPLPVSARLEVETVEEAIKMFPDAIKDAVVKMMDEAKEHQRREANRIVTPGDAPSSNIIM